MVQKFSRKELQRLGCTDDEIELVMKYQILLPMPDKDFEMDARTLHEYLGVGKVFAAWITGRIKKYDFVENIDYKIKYNCDDSNSGNTDFTSFEDFRQLSYQEMELKKTTI